MKFKIIKYYVQICDMINVNPSFEGLREFYKFYSWERNNYGRTKMGAI